MPEQRERTFSEHEVKRLEEAVGLAFDIIAEDKELLIAHDARNVVARFVMAMAAGGEWGPNVLATGAVAELRQVEQIRRSALSSAVGRLKSET